jgi:hypothetical protein
MTTAFVRIAGLRRIGAFGCALVFSSAVLAQVPMRHPLQGGGYTATAPAAEPTAPAQPSATGKPSAAISAAPATDATEPVSQLQQPPKQAVIETQPDKLTIRADNASLTQTLQRISDKTGMQLEGISGDQRVFGNFGPGAPRDVLSLLLNGSGYNILMIGALDNGVPRQLILSQKKADASSSQRSTASQQPVNASPDDDVPDQSPPDDQPIPNAPGHGGEGIPQGIRTPQQMLQQMQQMRQQADQQQTANQ